MVNYSTAPLDAAFAALADPTRRRILESLSTRDRRVKELAAPFSMSLPAVSKHLRVLEKAGLLKRRRIGREHHIALETAPIRNVSHWVEQYRKFWEGSLDSLAAYLENQPKTKKERKKKKS